MSLSLGADFSVAANKIMASEDDYFSRLERKKFILELMEAGDWRGVVEQFDADKNYREPLLVWLKPSIEMLKFLETCLLGNLGISKVHFKKAASILHLFLTICT